MRPIRVEALPHPSDATSAPRWPSGVLQSAVAVATTLLVSSTFWDPACKDAVSAACSSTATPRQPVTVGQVIGSSLDGAQSSRVALAWRSGEIDQYLEHPAC